MAQVPARTVLLAIIFLLLLYYPPNQAGTSPITNLQIESQRSASWDALDVLNSSHYGDFAPWTRDRDAAIDPERPPFLNLTGFRETDGFLWDALPKVQQRFREQVNYWTGERGLQSLNDTRPQDLSQYSNITSWTRGQWTRSTLETPSDVILPNLTQVSPETTWSNGAWERNITGDEGTVWLRLVEPDEHGDETSTDEPLIEARGVTASLSIQDRASVAVGWSFSMRGVHFLSTGTTILSSGSSKYSGTYALPHMALSEPQYLAMQHSLNITFPKFFRRREKELRTSREMEPEMEIPKCELIMYLQQEPLQALSRSNIDRLEDELRFPTGLSFHQEPSIRMSAVMYSPDCGFVLETKGPPDHSASHHLTGSHIERFTSAVRHVLEAGIAVLLTQLYLLLLQMKASETPARQSRISIQTLTMMTLGDSLVWISLLFAAPLNLELNLLLLAASFAAFLGSNLFPMRFLMDIFAAQEPERLEAARERERLNSAAASATPYTSEQRPEDELATATNPAQSQQLPLPVTAIRFVDTAASPLPIPTTTTIPGRPTLTINPSVAREQRPGGTFGALYTRLTLAMMFLLFSTIHTLTSFSARSLSIYMRLVSLVYFSFWVPQILRNISRNTSRALLPSFIAGESLVRLLPFTYIWAYPENVLYVQPDRLWLCVLAGWLWLQCCMLAAQEVLGPRFCVTKRGYAGRFWGWMGIREAWDWHPLLREDEEGVTLPMGLSGPDSPVEERGGRKGSIDEFTMSGKPDRKKGVRMYECAICMQRLEVPVLPMGESDTANAASVLERRKYMVTPCRHIFHAPCLEAWTGMRLQCPICRENLPPI